MTRKVSIARRWTGPVPIGQSGQPVPKNLWPRRRAHTWEVRWFALTPTGQPVRRSLSFDTREAAEREQAARQAELDRNPAARRRGQRVTLREFIVQFQEARAGAKGKRLAIMSLIESVRSLERLAKSIGRDTPLENIRPADAMMFISGLHAAADGPGAGTINKIKRTLRAAFTVAVSPMGYLSSNPFAGIRSDDAPGRKVRYVTPAEFSALIRACDGSGSPLWWRALLTVCYTAGLRYSEAIHLTWADVDFARDEITVNPKADGTDTLAWTPKDRERRTVPVPAATMTVLAAMQQDAPERHPYVFIPAARLAGIKAAQEAGLWKEQQAVINNYGACFRRLVRRAAMDAPTLVHVVKPAEGRRAAVAEPTISIHDLRRSAVTNWAASASMKTVMEMAGHSNISTTERYYNAVTDEQREPVRATSAAAIGAALAQSDAKVTQNAHSAACSTAATTANPCQ